MWSCPTGSALRITCSVYRENRSWSPWSTMPSGCSCFSDSQFRLYCTDHATHQGRPADCTEASRVEWVPLASVRGLIKRHEIDDGATLTVLLFLIAFGVDGRGDRRSSTAP
jgi:hypothetical protein